MTQNDKRLSELFNELVPASGKAASRAGELIRATMRVNYRFFNDGDRIGIGYGKETCNAAARFLMKRGGGKIAGAVSGLWGLEHDEVYERKLDELTGIVADYVDSHPELRTTETDDMWDYFDSNEDRDDSWDDEEEEEGSL